MVSYQDLRWSPLAPIPERTRLPVQLPLPESHLFDSVHGEIGDLLVIQIRSGEHQIKKRQNTLRSLGLKGVRSASLRSSSDEITRGYIAAVRDLVAVIELDGVKYKQRSNLDRDTHLEYETISFGTSSRPGGIVRDSLGEYCSFESDRNGILINWSTSLSFLECYAALQDSGEEPLVMASLSGTKERPEDENLSALAITAPSNQDVDFKQIPVDTDSAYDDSAYAEATDIIEVPTDEALSIIRSNESAIAVARLAFRGLAMTWQRPYVRFIDSERAVAEVGLYSRKLDFQRARRFARATGASKFFAGAGFEVLVREHGNLKRIPL